ncbi:MAG: potassium-transporting ATPase subunit B, partial [Candidatus Dormibacteraeota bacterium]|nr:potassium-transporting ATPase subunit B [Candidatus Dormibacteraeota bacterium]
MEQRDRSQQYQRRRHSNLLDRQILVPAIGESFRKLDPRWTARNPVMFVVEIGAVITTIAFVAGLFQGASGSTELFVGQVTVWLWFTVLFANFAEAVAEGRGKAQAASLRRTRSELVARRLVDGREERVPAPQLRKGDKVVCEAGDLIPGDGTVIEG